MLIVMMGNSAWLICTAIGISLVLSSVLANIPPKEHKVHNIVLYPDKHSWCKVTPIKQVISHAGCQTKNIDNNVCVGTCFSFSVPKTIPETPGDEQLHYCDSCQSSESTWITVSLDCHEDDSSPTKVEKSVEIIGNCSCMYCKQKAAPPPRPTEEEDLDYEEEPENLKMYDLQQLKHAALKRRHHANSATAASDMPNNRLPLQEEEKTIETVSMWNRFKAFIASFHKCDGL